MLSNEQGNFAEAQQTQQINSDLADAQSLQRGKQSKQKAFSKVSKKALFSVGHVLEGVVGGAIGSLIINNWPTIAPVLQTVADAIVAAAPIGGIVIGSVAALGIALFCGYKIFEHRAKIKAVVEKAFGQAKGGLEYVAKQTVKGAKLLGGKAVKGCKYSANSLKRGASVVGNTMREGTSDTLKTVGRKLSGLGESMGNLDSIPYSTTNQNQGVMLLEEEKIKKFSSIRELFFEEIFQDEISNKSALVKKVLSQIGSKIAEKAYSVPNQGVSNSRLINQLEEQADFISKLDAKKLKNLLAEDNYNPQLYKIFSEHHDEIKQVIKECKEKHLSSESERSRSSESERSRSSESERNRSSFSSIASSISSLGRKKSSRQSTSSLPESGSLHSVSTDGSEAELLNPKKHKEMKQSNWFSWPIRGKSAKKKTTEVEYQSFSDSDSDSGSNRFAGARRSSNASIEVASPTVTRASMTPGHSVESLASNDSFSSASRRLSNKSANSYSFSRTPTPPPLPLDGKIPAIRSESSSSVDSGMSSSGSSTPKRSSSMGGINKHSGPQVQVKQNELQERRNSLKKTGSLENLVRQSLSQVTVCAEAYQHDTAVKSAS